MISGYKRLWGKLFAMTACLVLWLATTAAASASAHPGSTLDEIKLSNGSLLLGQVLSAQDGIVEVKTDFAGLLKIKLDQVLSMSTSPVRALKLKDGSVKRNLAVKVEQQQLLLEESATTDHYPLHQLVSINPQPWELGEGVLPSGKASFAWATERGNSDTDKLDVLVDSSWRRLRDRYTLRATGELDSNNGERSAENWKVLGKYDHFIADNRYWGTNLSVESNEFTDLNLRTYLGPYYGLQWFDRNLLSLSTEFGLAYVDEEFIDADDQQSSAANWSLDATSNYLGGSSRLYLNQVGILSLDGSGDVIVNTRMGLAFPLLGQVEASAELLLEYDSGALDAVKELDQTYNFRIGYAW